MVYIRLGWLLITIVFATPKGNGSLQIVKFYMDEFCLFALRTFAPS